MKNVEVRSGEYIISRYLQITHWLVEYNWDKVHVFPLILLYKRIVLRYEITQIKKDPDGIGLRTESCCIYITEYQSYQISDFGFSSTTNPTKEDFRHSLLDNVRRTSKTMRVRYWSHGHRSP